jgi:alanyl-tRNA synthetase
LASLEARTHTALHIPKGAVMHVLGEQSLRTASAPAQEARSRLTASASGKPSREQLEEIERLTNSIIEAGS